jgi:succinate dehydrogenase / fumarate reductase cytochrome b subunit
MASSSLPAVARAHPSTHPLVRWIFSSIGKKTVIAVTGVAMVLFLFGHLAGNLTYFLGQDAINTYAAKLRDYAALLWVARIGLLVAVALHIWFTMLIWKENHAARTDKYRYKSRVQSTVFARTMRMTGLIVFAFLIFHLSHFTWQVVNPDYKFWHDDHGRHDVHRMVFAGFSSPYVSGFYIVSLAMVTFHLSHGIGSLFQTLGITNRRLRPIFEGGGRIIAWLLFLGYTSIPVSILVFDYGKDALK